LHPQKMYTPVKKADLLGFSSYLLDSQSTADTFSTPSQIHTPLGPESDATTDGFLEEQTDLENISPLEKQESELMNKVKKKSKAFTDRFIPNRKTSKLDIAFSSSHEFDDPAKSKKKNGYSKRRS